MSSDRSFTSERRVIDLLVRIADGIDGLRDDLGSAVELLGESSKRRDDDVGDSTKEPDRLLTQREVADLLRVHPRTLRTMSLAGEVPKPVMIGRSPRWSRRAIERFIEERQR